MQVLLPSGTQGSPPAEVTHARPRTKVVDSKQDIFMVKMKEIADVFRKASRDNCIDIEIEVLVIEVGDF